jgi:hypothetical protein
MHVECHDHGCGLWKLEAELTADMDTHAGSLSRDQTATSVQRSNCVPAAIPLIKHREDLFVHSVVNFIQIYLWKGRMLVSTETPAQSGRAFKTAF